MATPDIQPAPDQRSPGNGATRMQLAQSVTGLIQAVRQSGAGGADVKGAVTALSITERDLCRSNQPFACLKAAWRVLNASEDIALRAPDVVHHLQQVGSLFGVS